MTPRKEETDALASCCRRLKIAPSADPLETARRIDRHVAALGRERANANMPIPRPDDVHFARGWHVGAHELGAIREVHLAANIFGVVRRLVRHHARPGAT